MAKRAGESVSTRNARLEEGPHNDGLHFHRFARCPVLVLPFGGSEPLRALTDKLHRAVVLHRANELLWQLDKVKVAAFGHAVENCDALIE